MVSVVETHFANFKLVFRRKAPSSMATTSLSLKKNVTSQLGFDLVML